MSDTSNAKRLDQFYTSDAVALQCLLFLKEYLGSESQDAKYTYVEPSAGGGAFFKLLPENCRVGIDLDPKCEGVVKADYLTWGGHEIFKSTFVVVVGNPPFGKNASLALKFVNRSGEYAKIVAFVCAFNSKMQELEKVSYMFD